MMDSSCIIFKCPLELCVLRTFVAPTGAPQLIIPKGEWRNLLEGQSKKESSERGPHLACHNMPVQPDGTVPLTSAKKRVLYALSFSFFFFPAAISLLPCDFWRRSGEPLWDAREAEACSKEHTEDRGKLVEKKAPYLSFSVSVCDEDWCAVALKTGHTHHTFLLFRFFPVPVELCQGIGSDERVGEGRVMSLYTFYRPFSVSRLADCTWLRRSWLLVHKVSHTSTSMWQKAVKWMALWFRRKTSGRRCWQWACWLI